MTTTILPSANLDWGYWGTISRIENDPAADPTRAWEIASRRIAEATTASPEGGATSSTAATAATSPTTSRASFPAATR